VAVNYLITPRHGLRAVYSGRCARRTCSRTTSTGATRSRTSPQPYGLQDGEYFVKTRGPGNLDQERMRSRELGYNGYFSDIDLSMDVKLFYDEITGMISEPLKNNQYIASNANKARFTGSEAQFDWRLTQRDRLRLTYAYVDAWASNPDDRRLSARNSGSAGWLREWGRLVQRAVLLR
jgi:iron complex outermembrane receptor protein